MSLAKLLYELKNPALSAVNPHFKSKYAPLDEVLRVVKPMLEKHGFVLSQTVEDSMFITRLVSTKPDESFCGFESAFPFPHTENAQKLGSALTYCRRYGILLLLGLVGEEDDDGNAAMTGGGGARKDKPKKTTVTKNGSW